LALADFDKKRIRHLLLLNPPGLTSLATGFVAVPGALNFGRCNCFAKYACLLTFFNSSGIFFYF
jgi:hypothetical protein